MSMNLDPVSELIARAEASGEEHRAAMEEIRKARNPQYGLRQPLQAIQKIARPLGGSREDGTLGFKSLGHFCKSIAGHRDFNTMSQVPEMKPYMGYIQKTLPTGMNETVGGDGGFLIPPEFSNQLLMRTYANDLLSRTTMFPLTTSNNMRIPAINETSRADGSRFGGVQAYWRAEAGSVTNTKPNFELVNLQLNSLMLVVRMTDEVLQDSGAIETYVNLVADQELAFKIGDSIVNGDGVSKPLGLLNSPSKISISKESGQAAKTIVAANVLKMMARLHLSCWPNAVWLIDQSIIPQLSQMTIGTAGSQMVVYMPPGGLSALPYATLMGKPVIPVEFCKQLGTEGDIILTDLATHLSATKGGMMTASSIHVYFLTDEQAFRFIMRLDARNWWLTALTPKSGGDSQSNIITLATRS